jgi:hypothetical protein
MSIDSDTWRTYFGRDNTPGPFGEAAAESADPMNLAGAGAGSHYKNFIGAIRSGKKDDLNCDIEAGHISTALPHLANISYRLSRELVFDGANERFTGDSEADKMLRCDYRKPYIVPEQV